MATFLYKTRGDSSPERKPHIYFTYHPEDFSKCFEKICKDIFKTQDCAIFYTDDLNVEIEELYKESDLSQMNLFVIPVTSKLLRQPNRAMDSDIRYAQKKHIPVLPIMMEPGLDSIYSQQDKFGELQYLDPYLLDLTAIPYEEKLKKYLMSVLISDEMAERVRKAFDAYIFLSYRKKDRHYANELMKMIHSHPEFRNLAIWYDEFLTPSESFRKNIERMMKNSKLFALLVTPNLLEYVDDQSPEGTDDTTAPPKAETTIDPAADKYDENGYLKDGLPEITDLGVTIGMLYWSDVENTEFFADENTNDAVEAAINRRNAKVEARLGVKIEYTGTPGNNKNRNDYINRVRNTYATDNPYDIYAGYTMTMATAAINGFCTNLLDYEVIDFEAPWWPQKLIEESTINNKLFFATGDLSTNLLYMMYVIYFNKDLMTQYNAGDPYESMDSNTWTYETMINMSHTLDGMQSLDTPIYGFTANTMHTDPFFYGAGLRTIDRDENGTPIISDLFGSERTQNVVTLVESYLSDPISLIGSKCNTTFQSGNAMFLMSRARYASRDLGDVSFNYGIAPIPKFTADQDGYSTCLGFPATFYSVSGAAQHPEEAAMVLECLSSEGYRIITPVLFEVTMKVRYSQDPVASKTFDTARAGVCFDLGRTYSDVLDNLTYSIFRSCICKGNPNFMRNYSMQLDILQSKLEEMIKAFD